MVGKLPETFTLALRRQRSQVRILSGAPTFSFIVNGLENPQNLSAPQVKIRAPMGHLVVHDEGDIEAEARGSNPLSPTNISKCFGAF